MGAFIDTAIPVVTFLMMVTVGHGLAMADLRKSVTDLRAMVAATVGQLVILPLIATVIILIGHPSPTVIAGLVLVIAVVRGLEIFEVEVDRRIEEMEQRQILLTERERISRELHDGAIQTVYTAGLMAESIRNKMDDGPLADSTKP